MATSPALILFFVLLVTCSVLADSSNCQFRVAQYYSSVNTGNFTGALSTLTDDVVYYIKGQNDFLIANCFVNLAVIGTPGLLPFVGTWVNKTGVVALFSAFGSTFQVSLILIRQMKMEN